MLINKKYIIISLIEFLAFSLQEDGAEVQEWERFAAFHEDITKQERTKERLFEEDLEVCPIGFY